MQVSLTKLKAWPGRVRKGALMDPSYHKWGEESYRTTEERNVRKNGRPLLVSFIYWCRSALKAMNPVVLSGGYMLILIYSICATERWSSIVGCSKKYAAWIWSICLSSFVFCVTVLFGPGKKKKLQCLKNICKEQSVKLRARSEVRVWQSDAISTLSLTNYGHLKHILVYIFFFSCSGCTYRKEKRKAINWPLTCCVCLKVIKEPIMKLSVEYFWGSNKGGSVDNVTALPK